MPRIPKPQKQKLKAKIKILLKEGYPPKQAVAIAYRMIAPEKAVKRMAKTYDVARGRPGASKKMTPTKLYEVLAMHHRLYELDPGAEFEDRPGFEAVKGFVYYPNWYESTALTAKRNPDRQIRESDPIGPYRESGWRLLPKEFHAVEKAGKWESIVAYETSPESELYFHPDAVDTTSEIGLVSSRHERTGRDPGHRKPKRGRPIGSPYRREGLSAWQAQQKRRKGPTVNETLPEPQSPCPDELDGEQCAVCGEYYQLTTLGAGDVQAASRLVRQAAGGWGKGGGYRSRGPLLWAMHTIKLQRWYERHFPHCEMAHAAQEETGSDFVAIPPAVVWAEFFGNRKLERLANSWYQARKNEEQNEPFRDWEASPMAPTEYSRKMISILKRIRVILDSATHKGRKRLEYPSRLEEGTTWDAKADRQLLSPDEEPGDLPF
jgi:hypothetical protein